MEMDNENESHHKSVQQIQHPFHEEHPLVLVAEQNNEGLKAYCDGCGELLSAPCFTCLHCNYHLHKQCAKAPLSLPNHPLHPRHSDAVIVIASATYAKRNIPGLFMVALFVILTSMLNVLGRGPLLKIKATISTHSPCFGDKVKLDRGSYSCGKPGCNYIVHVNCVLEDNRLYKVIEEEKQYEELYEKSIQYSIIRVIEVNEAGEAIKIEHFSHQHCLVLADKMEEEIDRKCNGCMLSISTLFYYCLECPFFLHKTCAELRKIKRHWFRQWNATLDFEGCLDCDFCSQHCSGFFYRIKGWQICIRCAKVADIIECEGHQHFLFYDFKCKEKCNGCGNKCRYGAFRCGECRFALDFGCLTLPYSAFHKIDEHMLNLTYHDDREQSYFDICEQERDPRLWYYSCSNCDTSAHTECVLGQFPFLKDGSKFSYYNHKHQHDLKFFRKAEGYPECSYCGKLCQEEILKCKKSTCNYIVHCKCRNYQV
ncbi:hypothetical protein CXB51_016089 [Gossypium anomalum]|uniref:Phorbol-ester/DAG-type domain-containing protein n=1 Tax=Gossypium anomalum TaxID=47600 RepID=A0A8J6D0E1_9ROSI|nr:hypothetical protein CXB51_016089 [Gossypium anomalum]